MKTKIIAELCYNHQGDMDIAKKMIDECADLGLWAVKLQKWDIDSFPPEIKNKKRSDKNAFGKTYIEHRRALEFHVKQLIELKDYAESKGLVFICSGKDFESVKQIVFAGIKHIKLPSQRYFDNKIYNFLMANKADIKIYVSTGMNTEHENLKSKWTRHADVVFHCVSLYPVKDENADLGIIRKYDFYNGYSCHEKTGRGIKYAVAMGVEYIERHYTFDKKAKGSDHLLSSDKTEMQRIIKEVNEAEMMTGPRRMTRDEELNRNYYRGF